MHAFPRATERVARALTGDDEIVVPMTFGIEVAGALGREGIPLCTLDQEMAARGASVCRVTGP